jgi:hypothetical protein
MTQSEPLAAPTASVAPAADVQPPDHGINLVSVLVALVVLAALVVGIFWGLPAWFGSSVINVTVRS